MTGRVLLLHGLGSSAAHVTHQLGPAIPSRATLVAPDLRAHGESAIIGEPADFDLDRLAAETVTEHLGPAASGPLAIVGVSLGAAIAVRIALAGLARPDRLVLVRPSFTDVPVPPNLRAFPVMGELLMRHGPDDAEQRFRASSLHYALSLESRAGAAAALQQFRAPDAAARAIRLIEIPRNRAYRNLNELGAISVPTTIVAAQQDPVHPVAVAEEWHRGIRGSSLVTVPGRDRGMPAHLTQLRSAVRQALR